MRPYWSDSGSAKFNACTELNPPFVCLSLPYFYTWCGLSANLECMSEMCCKWLAAKYRTQKLRQKSSSAHHRTTLSGYRPSQLRHVSTIEKNLLNGNISSICPHYMVNFGPLTAEICWRVWSTPSKFQRVLRLGFVTAPTSLNRGQPNFAGCLAVSWAGKLYIHFLGLLPRNGILPAASIHFASKSCDLLYWQRYCTALE